MSFLLRISPSPRSANKRLLPSLAADGHDIEIIPRDALQGAVRMRNVLVCSSFGVNRACRWPTLYPKLSKRLRVRPDDSAPRLIYRNRSHAGRRGIENEEAFEDMLTSLGFKVVRAGEMAYQEQRRIFANARMTDGFGSLPQYRGTPPFLSSLG
jgi:capsular polysaccharide biosynthesis protein